MNEYGETRNRELAAQLRETTRSFLITRMNDRNSVEWGVQLAANCSDERDAIREILRDSRARIDEPYKSAWAWLIESWDERPAQSNQPVFFHDRALRHSDDVRRIVEMVRPWPRIKKLEDWQRYGGAALPKKPRRLNQVVSIGIESGNLLRLEDIGLRALADDKVLAELFDRLENAVRHGLSLAERLGWASETEDLSHHFVQRVYYVPERVVAGETLNDPDEYRTGLAPSVKLLYEVADKLFVIKSERVRGRIAAWRMDRYVLFRRLWAALARNVGHATSDEVAAFILDLSDREFWRQHQFPEFTELRATWFSRLEPAVRQTIEHRILRLPPKSLWNSKIEPHKFREIRRYIAATELRRIEVAEGALAPKSSQWLNDVAGEQDIPAFDRVDFDFDPTIGWREPKNATGLEITDIASSFLTLDAALAADDLDGHYSAARAYIRERLTDLLIYLNSHLDFAAKFPRVVREMLFVMARSPGASTSDADEDEEDRSSLGSDNDLMIRLLQKMKGDDLEKIADRATAWLESSIKLIADHEWLPDLWTRLWLAATDFTNNLPRAETDAGVAELQGEDNGEKLAVASLNTPVGLMMTALFKIFPRRTQNQNPFERGMLKDLRNLSISANGPARRQVLHRYVSIVDYMQASDPDWTYKHILGPLVDARSDDIEIWDAVARGSVIRYQSMKIIGERMARIAHAGMLDSDTEARLSERVILRVLLDKGDGIAPSVPDSEVQQMLRLGSDRVRSASAGAINIFLDSDKKSTREDKFRKVVKPFFELVWPQERTLTSRSLSSRLAQLPSKTGASFSDAAAIILRFLTPFDCWSLHDFGLYGHGIEGKKLVFPRDSSEAQSLLLLLDASIGADERAIKPYDLDLALVEIKAQSSKLAKAPSYERLVALVRK